MMQRGGAEFVGKLRSGALMHALQKVWHSPRYRLENVGVDSWTRKDVVEFLRVVFPRGTPGIPQVVERAFRENDIDGSILMELDLRTLRAIGIEDEEDIRILNDAIEMLQRQRPPRTAPLSLMKVRSKLLAVPERSALPQILEVSGLFGSGTRLKQHFGGPFLSGGVSLANVVDFGNDRISIGVTPLSLFHAPTILDPVHMKDASPQEIAAAGGMNLEGEELTCFLCVIYGQFVFQWSPQSVVVMKLVPKSIPGLSWVLPLLTCRRAAQTSLGQICDEAETTSAWYSRTDDRSGSSTRRLFVERALHEAKFKYPSGNFSATEFVARCEPKSCPTGGADLRLFCPARSFRDRFTFPVLKRLIRSHTDLDELFFRIHSESHSGHDAGHSLFDEHDYVYLCALDRLFWLYHRLNPENEAWKPSAEGCPCGKPE